MIDRRTRQQRVPQGLLRDLASLDQALYETVTVTSTPALDSALRRLSAAADHSKISLLIAAALALRPGRSRRAAVLGVAAIGVASTTANLLGKRLVRRPRPHRAEDSPFPGRHVPIAGVRIVPLRSHGVRRRLRRGGRARVPGRHGPSRTAGLCRGLLARSHRGSLPGRRRHRRRSRNDRGRGRPGGGRTLGRLGRRQSCAPDLWFFGPVRAGCPGARASGRQASPDTRITSPRS